MRSKSSYYFFGIFLLPFLFLLQNPAIQEPVRSTTLSALKPFLVVGEATAQVVSKTRDGMVRFWNAFRDQGVSQARIAQLESEVLRLREMTKENERLRKLLDFRQTLTSKAVAARVIGWDPSPWRRTFILDKGKNQGIRKDMSVLVPEGLVGRVLQVGPSSARVLLLTDPDARVSAMSEQTRAQGIVAGDGSPKLKMTYLDLDSGAAVGEIVTTSGLGGLFSKGIRIGKITGLSKDPTGLHLEAQIESFVSFSKLEEVLCIASLHQK